MQSQKEFYFVGNHLRNKTVSALVIIAGILGAGIILYGFTQTPAQKYYVAGSGLLLITALYFKLTYFIALELILLAGHGAILLGIGPVLQLWLPILLSLQLFIYYLLNGELKNIFRIIGVAGIALVSIGLSYINLWIFFFGSLFVAIFALNNVYRGKIVALIWAILNLFFAFATGFLIIAFRGGSA